jgi:hypothetical protein
VTTGLVVVTSTSSLLHYLVLLLGSISGSATTIKLWNIPDPTRLRLTNRSMQYTKFGMLPSEANGIKLRFPAAL